MKPAGPALLLPPLLLLLGAGGRAEVLFSCPPCSPESLAACPPPAPDNARPCVELAREPGCGCCAKCALLEGEACGVYTQRCAHGLHCYPRPGAELPLQALLQGAATCEKVRDPEDSDQGRDYNYPGFREATIVGGGGGAGRKAFNPGMKEMAVLREKVNDQHRQMGKGGKHPPGPEDSKKLRPSSPRTPCQQELDQVLERISTMRLPDERGPLEHLYSLHIPNCDKSGLYNLKQCKMAVNGQRGECWCVDPNTGKLLQGSPTVRGDPECQRYYNERMQ
ncbi:unnamed protein product [Pipistrellus nathusii]|uniref:Insulin-like growth factor-binding protein 2 n=1 Tax=Pipistrellus nathusii TaxID=59473 RepID=A0ABP0AHZ0_PIPNA